MTGTLSLFVIVFFFCILAGGVRSASEQIIDNSATGGAVDIAGPWTSSIQDAGYIGPDYLSTQGTDSTVEWFPSIDATGQYLVYASYSAASSRATNVMYTVKTTDGSQVRYVNQQALASPPWGLVGLFTLGPSSSVKVCSSGTDGIVIADAIRLVLQDPKSSCSSRTTQCPDSACSPDEQCLLQVIDDGATTLSGTWAQSNRVPGYEGGGYLWFRRAVPATAAASPDDTQEQSSSGGPPSPSPPSAVYSPALTQGRYKVWERHSCLENRATNAHLFVSTSDGVADRVINQREGGGAWNFVGEFDLTARSTVTLSAGDTPDGVVVADAVMWTSCTPKPGAATAAASSTSQQPADATRTARINNGALLNCPNRCSLRGDCDVVQRKCLCDAGWTGPDCSGMPCPDDVMTGCETCKSVVRDTDDEGVFVLGAWNSGTSPAGYIGDDYLWAATKSSTNVLYTFPDLPEGMYHVYSRHTSLPNRATNTPISIFTNDLAGTVVVPVDQTRQGGTWVPLGSYKLNGGTTVRVEASAANGIVVADGIMVATCTKLLAGAAPPALADQDCDSPSDGEVPEPQTSSTGVSYVMLPDGSVDPGVRGVCPQNCNGHGVCLIATLTCDCSMSAFKGTACQERRCPNDCSGHGDCTDGVCTCACNYTGLDCADLVCPNNCKPHGLCNPKTGQCDCTSPYYGPSCNVLPCPANCTSPDQGVCDTQTGKCTCMPRYRGADCAEVKCPNNCYKHGVCSKDTGVCDCYARWQGDDCSQPLCYNNCSGHGTCRIGGNCTCTDGFSGPDCSVGCPVGYYKVEKFANSNLLDLPTAWDCELGPMIEATWTDEDVNKKPFSIRWNGLFNFPSASIYRFVGAAKDGVRVYVDQHLIIDLWRADSDFNYKYELPQGMHWIEVEWFQAGAGGAIEMRVQLCSSCEADSCVDTPLVRA